MNYHVVNALVPVADAFAGTKYTTPINMEAFHHVSFIIQTGVGTTGTSTITILASDDISRTHTTAVPFHYQACVSGDTFGATAAAETTGFTTAAGSNKMYKIEVDNQALASTGYGYVILKAVEVAASPVLGGILAILTEPRYGNDVFDTAIV